MTSNKLNGCRNTCGLSLTIARHASSNPCMRELAVEPSLVGELDIDKLSHLMDIAARFEFLLSRAVAGIGRAAVGGYGGSPNSSAASNLVNTLWD
jgi:hypothetical protein